MDAPCPPRSIVREHPIDLTTWRWWRLGRPYWLPAPRPRRGAALHFLLLVVLVPVTALCQAIQAGVGPEMPWLCPWPILWTPVGLAVTAAVVEFRRRRVETFRRLRAQVGDTGTFYVQVDAEGVELGFRPLEGRWLPWTRCSLGGRDGMMRIGIGSGVAPVPLAAFSAQERAQIHYWCSRAWGIPDSHLCPQCRYDLTGSPGPTCPECGAAVRLADVTGLAAPKQ